jgi:Cu(I)/Ag(I) efflux system protein CusF
MQTLRIMTLAAALGLAAILPLQAADPGHGGHSPQPAASGTLHQGRGVVEALDRAKGVVTLEHDPIPALRWPKMVMDFKVEDPAQLAGLKEGDRVAFDLRMAGKEYSLARIAPAP